jgi:transcriptional regulator
MRSNPDYDLDDEAVVRQLIKDNPLATMITNGSAGLVASHIPLVIEDGHEGLTIVTHLGRPDEERHELGDHEVVIVVQGPNGYISPSWYNDGGPAVPTWNFATAHLYGVPEPLDADENFQALVDLVDHFESQTEAPRRLLADPQDADYAKRIHHGTAGFRLRVTRFEAKLKHSQDKPAAVVDTILDRLDGVGPYANAALADAMRRSRG